MNTIQKETIVGSLIVALGVLFLTYSHSHGGGALSGRAVGDGYEITAQFSRSDGLGPQADVRMGGISVGKVAGQSLTNDYHSLITLRLVPGVPVPVDTAALIRTDGLLGAKFIELEPGGSETLIGAGGRLQMTQGSLLVEDLLNRISDKIRSAHRPSSDAAAAYRATGNPRK
ncbi:MAG: MCE family protein [Alphaproteobacteria bacterium]|nr:MCE family protein [Alphaproteobacteria bacterium]